MERRRTWKSVSKRRIKTETHANRHVRSDNIMGGRKPIRKRDSKGRNMEGAKKGK